MDFLKVFLLSAVPVIEIRGGLPLGILLGLPKWEAFLVSVLGNTVIIVPWMMVLAKAEKHLAKNRMIHGFYNKLVRRVERKRKSFQKYGKFALFLFVAVPFPITGAWTACIAARLFRIPIHDAFIIITFGVVTSGLIILLLKYLALLGFA